MSLTADIQPTMRDSEVLEFCKQGFILLPGVVPADVNRRLFQYLEEHPDREPSSILEEEDFVRGVLLHPEVAGIVRSLLGKQFALPYLISNHRQTGINRSVGGWHQDAGSLLDPITCNYLQVFYYPQDVSVEMGPTALIPGSHFVQHNSAFMGHFGHFAGEALTAAPAGSVFITAYPIWHRVTKKTDPRVRNLLKWTYWRTVPPKRDWVREADFDIATAPFRSHYAFGAHLPISREPAWSVAEMFLWLCGQQEEFKLLGGQAWPLENDRGVSADNVRETVRIQRQRAMS